MKVASGNMHEYIRELPINYCYEEDIISLVVSLVKYLYYVDSNNTYYAYIMFEL